MSLPMVYKWLETLRPLPRMVDEALKLYGTHEAEGPGDNPTILAWAKELSLSDYNHDSIPWCGLFMGLVAQRAQKFVPWKDPDDCLWALNWRGFGSKSPQASLGDVLVFKRPEGGHVGLYVGQDATAYHVLGGNEADQVNIVRIGVDRCVAVRQPMYHHIPSSVRPIQLAATGKLSANEQ